MRDTGHADRYAKLSVNYIDHHNPDLFLFDSDGEEVQRIDLTRVKTTARIHKIMEMLQMRENCRDDNMACADWARDSQCEQNPVFMLQTCRKSCGVCKEGSALDSSTPCTNTAPEHDCQYWSTLGEVRATPAPPLPLVPLLSLSPSLSQPPCPPVSRPTTHA